MTRCVIDAIVQSGVYAILSKGWSDRLQVKRTSYVAEPDEPLPKQIYQINSIPHDWLFRRIDAACHHGGAGTTGASLRGDILWLPLSQTNTDHILLAGIPTIIKPFFGDQFFWADRVEALGVGSGVRKLTVESLTTALIAATTDIKQIERAKLVGEQIRSVSEVYVHYDFFLFCNANRRMGQPPLRRPSTVTLIMHVPWSNALYQMNRTSLKINNQRSENIIPATDDLLLHVLILAQPVPAEELPVRTGV